jgi:hypothetical protein
MQPVIMRRNILYCVATCCNLLYVLAEHLTTLSHQAGLVGGAADGLQKVVGDSVLTGSTAAIMVWHGMARHGTARQARSASIASDCRCASAANGWSKRANRLELTRRCTRQRCTSRRYRGPFACAIWSPVREPLPPSDRSSSALAAEGAIFTAGLRRFSAASAAGRGRLGRALRPLSEPSDASGSKSLSALSSTALRKAQTFGNAQHGRLCDEQDRVRVCA